MSIWLSSSLGYEVPSGGAPTGQPNRSDDIAAVADFMRYYEVPGYNHAVSTQFNAAWDSLTALEDWVEKGTAPPPQVVADTAAVAGRTRPLCEYPSWPRYNGSGDVNLAASFTCVTQ